MKTLRVRVSEDCCFLKSDPTTYYFMSRDYLKQLFLPSFFNYEFVNFEEPADICIAGIQFKNPEMLRYNEVNIMICIENCSYWKWLDHYSKYGNYEDKNFPIYIYNHISEIENKPNYIGIPLIHFRIKHFTDLLEPMFKNVSFLNTSFKNKKFLLVVNSSKLNPEIQQLTDILGKIGQVDNIQQHSILKHKSCYNSDELLEVYNGYKFILCFENSYSDGYITEKIFNAFLSKSIPIYKGAPNTSKFINTNSFINGHNPNFINQIIELNSDETKYNEMINANKISSEYDDENFIQSYSQRLISKLNIAKTLKPKVIKKLIGFCLWGNIEIYTYGAIENALIAKELYPGWICRYYIHSDVDDKIVNTLRSLDNVEIVRVSNETSAGHLMFKRFIPAFFEEDVIFMSRDTDSRLNTREKAAVEEWLASDKDFHIMRDNHHHIYEILGGMWGCRNNILHNLRQEFNSNCINDNVNADQDFLKNYVYKQVRNTSFVHDAFYRGRYESWAKDFPPSNYNSFVGSYVLKAPLTRALFGESDVNKDLAVKYAHQATIK